MATVLTNAGRAVITNLMKLTGTELKWVGWGTGAGTAAVGNTTLFTEAAETRTVGTSSIVTTTVTDDTYRVTGTIVSLSTQTITNAGTFNALSSGSLGVKANFTGVDLIAGESIAFTFDIVLG